MWYVLFEMLSAKVEFLASFNVTKYGKTGIEYIEQMTYAVGSLMLKSIVVIHIVLQLHTPWSTLTERSISSKMDKPWQTLRVYSSQTMHQIYLKCSVNVPANNFANNFSLHKHFKFYIKRKISLVLYRRWMY